MLHSCYGINEKGNFTIGGADTVEFNKIKNAIQTKNYILLRSKANLIYIFCKDTFTVGTKEEFVSFLRAKGIKVKGK